jgi:hypothetical protein
MTKNRKMFIFVGIIIFVSFAIYLEMNRRDKSQLIKSSDRNSTSNIQDSGISIKRKTSGIGNPIRDFINAYQTPIEFYGKVIDQHGEAVGGASIKIFPVNNAFGTSDSRSDFEIASDPNGLFSVTNMKSLSIGIVVNKEGYLTFSDRGLGKPASSRSIDFGLSDTKGKEFKDANRPTLFTLHKIGPVEPLVYVDDQLWNLAVNGTPREIALDSEKGIGSHQIEFRFLSDWSKLPMDNEINSKRYNWSLVACIPGGGFIKNGSDYNSEAPKDGYLETIKFEYAASMPQDQWKRSRSERYFVKFADGTHGRIRFSIDGSSDMSPLLMTSWMNLKLGSRNLASPIKDATQMRDEK